MSERFIVAYCFKCNKKIVVDMKDDKQLQNYLLFYKDHYSCHDGFTLIVDTEKHGEILNIIQQYLK